MITSSRTYILSEIVETCRKLKKSGEDLLRNYFQLGRLVDTLHSMGLSYRQIEKDLRDKEPEAWIPRHTTLFNAHKFYHTVKKKFDADIERFMAENPELTWRELSHRLLPESRRKARLLSRGLSNRAGRLGKSMRLSKHDPEWEKLVAMLRKVAGSKTVVDQLWRAFENDGLVNEAREILPQTVAANQKKKKTAPNRLKRLYWCYIRKA
ncbi:MAG: hypothetical protein QXI60_09860 [Thermofilaceae archaeon]